MQQLTSNVFVETQVRGCNHGFVTTSDGIVMIDSPHKPSDAMKHMILSFDPTRTLPE